MTLPFAHGRSYGLDWPNPASRDLCNRSVISGGALTNGVCDAMNLFLAASAATGFCSAIGHSYLGERFVMAPLFARPDAAGVLGIPYMRRLLRWVWHLPSFAWAQIAAATLWLSVTPVGANVSTLMSYYGIGIYVTGAFFNALAMRKPHLGSVLLLLSAATLWIGLNL